MAAIVYDIVDDMEMLWFQVTNNKGVITVLRCNKGRYIPNDNHQLVRFMRGKCIDMEYNHDFVDANLDMGVIRVKNHGAQWDVYKRGQTTFTLTMETPILAPSYYLIDKQTINGSFTTLSNLVTWVRDGPADERDDRSDTVMSGGDFQ